MADQEQILEEARVAIVEKEFDKALALLQSIPDDPTAQQWMAKLDKVAPAAPAEAPPPAVVQTEEKSVAPAPVRALQAQAANIDTDAVRAQTEAIAGNIGGVLSAEVAVIRGADFSGRADAVPAGSARRYPMLNVARAVLVLGAVVMLIAGMCNGLNQNLVGGIDNSTRVNLRIFSSLISCLSLWAIAAVMIAVAEFIKLGMKVEDHLHNMKT
jgi:hypothetical protein